jgi:hypothetical protein
VKTAIERHVANGCRCAQVRSTGFNWQLAKKEPPEGAHCQTSDLPDFYYLAALAIESGSEWITTDRDYARFPGLRWRLPFP